MALGASCSRWLLAALVLGGISAGVVPGAGRARAEPGCGPIWGPMQSFLVEPGVLAAQVPWTVRVGPGDTIGALAQRHLGSTRHTRQVLDLNPGLDPRTLRVGKEIWLPPAGAAPGEWLELLIACEGLDPEPIMGRSLGATAAAYRVYPAGPVRVYALAQARLTELRRLGGGRVREADLLADPGVARSAPVEARAAEDRPVEKRVTRVRIVGLEGRTLALEILEQSLYSPTGHRLALAGEAPLEHGSLATPLLLLLAGLVVFGLVAWAARRMAGSAGGHAGDSGAARS